jgi:hypothetical protein
MTGHDFSGYNYGSISSLILTADKSESPRRDMEPDEAPSSSGTGTGTGTGTGAGNDEEDVGGLLTQILYHITMAGHDFKFSGYNYGSISSLILTADKSESALPAETWNPMKPLVVVALAPGTMRKMLVVTGGYFW